MRPGRAVGLCLIAVVLVQVGFFAGAPPYSGGNRFVLNRGARIPSVTSGTRTVAVPDGKPNAPGWIVQDLSPVLRTGWEALSFRPSGLTPPDVQVAVGPAHVVEAVNVALGVYSKEGVQLVTSALSTVFATGSDFLSDPRIQYDGLSGRWFVAAGDFTTGQVLVAASMSSDPTIGWSIYRVPSSATSECLDQPIQAFGRGRRRDSIDRPANRGIRRHRSRDEDLSRGEVAGRHEPPAGKAIVLDPRITQEIGSGGEHGREVVGHKGHALFRIHPEGDVHRLYDVGRAHGHLDIGRRQATRLERKPIPTGAEDGGHILDAQSRFVRFPIRHDDISGSLHH